MTGSASLPASAAPHAETQAVDLRAAPSAPAAATPKPRPLSATYRDHIPRAGCVPTPASLAAEREAVLAKERAALAERAAGNELGVYGGGTLRRLERGFPGRAVAVAAIERGNRDRSGCGGPGDGEGAGRLQAADPIEAMLLGQILSANATALELRQRAWRDRLPERQAALLNLADKSARTLAALTEALERHRARGRQRRSFARVERPGAYTCGCRPADFNPRSPKCDAGFQTIMRGIV